MQLIRAVFYKNGRITKRGYRTHVADRGLPLCRIATRQSHVTTSTEQCEWLTEFGCVPTCVVCDRMYKRRTNSNTPGVQHESTPAPTIEGTEEPQGLSQGGL